MNSLPIDPYPSTPTPRLAPNSAAPYGTSSENSFDDHLRSVSATNEQEPALLPEEPTARDIEDSTLSGDLHEESDTPTSEETEVPTREEAEISPPDTAEEKEESDEFIHSSDAAEVSTEIHLAILTTTDEVVEEGKKLSSEDLLHEDAGEPEIDEQTSNNKKVATESDSRRPAVLIDSSPVENRLAAQETTLPPVDPSNEVTNGNSKEERNGQPATLSLTDDSLAGDEAESFQEIADSRPTESESTAKKAKVPRATDRPATSTSSTEPDIAAELSALKTVATATNDGETPRGEDDNKSPRPRKTPPAKPADLASTSSSASTLPSLPLEGAGEIETASTRGGETSAKVETLPTVQALRVTDSSRSLQQRIVGIETPSTRPDDLAPAERNRFLHRVVRAFESAGEREGPIRLRLSPPELGSLRLEVQVEAGRLIARVETETTQARALLLDNLQGLRERLAEQNIRVDQFDVDLTDRQSAGSDMPQDDGPPLDERDAGSHDQSPEEAPESEAASSPTADASLLLPDRVNVII